MFAIIGDAMENFKSLFSLYRQSWEENGHNLRKFQVGVHVHAFFGEPMEEMTHDYFPIETFGLTRFSAHMDTGSPDHTNDRHIWLQSLAENTVSF